MPTSAKTCGSCGAQGQNGAFCDECGETLPETTTPAPPPVPEPEPVPVPAQDSAATPSFTPAPVPTEQSSEPQTRLDAFAPVPPAPEPPAPAAPAPLAQRTQPAVQPPAEPAPDAANRARDMLLPVSEPPKPENVAPAVLPDKPKPVAPVSWNKHQEEDVTGGTPCPWCATLNPAGRHFCRRCAMAMEKQPGESAPARLPWWRRMLDRDNRPIPYAGQRPRLRRGPGQLVRLLITLAIVLLLIIFASIFGGAAYDAIANHFAKPQLEPVQRVTASTNGLLGDSDPQNLADDYSNTYWGVGNRGTGGWADVLLQAPSDLLDVIVTPGAGATQSEFASQSSPQSLTFTMISESKQTTTKTVNLPNKPGPRVFPLVAKDVTKIHVVVGGGYPSNVSDPQIAISGLEFFGR